MSMTIPMNITKRLFVATVLLAVAVGPKVAVAATPSQICAAGKNFSTGKYAACLRNARAKFVLSGEDDDLKYVDTVEKCYGKHENKWDAVEEKGGGACTATDDLVSVSYFLDLVNRNLLDAIQGGQLYSACYGGLPATGQTVCYSALGVSIPCAGTAQDGELQHQRAALADVLLGRGAHDIPRVQRRVHARLYRSQLQLHPLRRRVGVLDDLRGTRPACVPQGAYAQFRERRERGIRQGRRVLRKSGSRRGFTSRRAAFRAASISKAGILVPVQSGR